jgi:hypothetical protein
VRTGCVRLFGLFMGFSAILRDTLVRCVLACTSPVAVNALPTGFRKPALIEYDKGRPKCGLVT